jgi:hypothetical protein
MMNGLRNLVFSWVLVAHACNPSYSGGRDQEDRGSKSDQTNSFRNPISKKKKKSQKQDCVEWLKVEGSEFKPQHRKKSKNKKKREIW